MNETHIGLLVLGVPALLIGGLILKRWRPVLWMYIAALAVGLWYLTGTGAVQDVGKQAMGYIPTSAPAGAPAATPAAAPAPEAAALLQLLMPAARCSLRRLPLHRRRRRLLRLRLHPPNPRWKRRLLLLPPRRSPQPRRLPLRNSRQASRFGLSPRRLAGLYLLALSQTGDADVRAAARAIFRRDPGAHAGARGGRSPPPRYRGSQGGRARRGRSARLRDAAAARARGRGRARGVAGRFRGTQGPARRRARAGCGRAFSRRPA